MRLEMPASRRVSQPPVFGWLSVSLKRQGWRDGVWGCLLPQGEGSHASTVWREIISSPDVLLRRLREWSASRDPDLLMPADFLTPRRASRGSSAAAEFFPQCVTEGKDQHSPVDSMKGSLKTVGDSYGG